MHSRPAPFAPVSPFHLRPHRVHEVEGLGAMAFVLYQAQLSQGPIIWLQLDRHDRDLMPVGLPQGIVARLQLVRCSSEEDLLWATEESLRSDAVDLVISCPSKALGLTAGRRLQLAAEAGASTGLMLIKAGQGSNAAETRWQCTPVAGSGDSVCTTHSWRCTKNKAMKAQDWIVEWDGHQPPRYSAGLAMLQSDG